MYTNMTILFTPIWIPPVGLLVVRPALMYKMRSWERQQLIVRQKCIKMFEHV